jgi:PIN domain nuclease of toxin-antitoxin system
VRLLLDSHVFVWWLGDSGRLSAAAREAMQAPTSEVFVSAASIWELAIKLSIGKIRWRSDLHLDASIAACGFSELSVTARHVAKIRDLPRHHADPFDRLLVAQALCEDLCLLTADDSFAPYGVRTLDPA